MKSRTELRTRLIARYSTVGLMRVFARDILGQAALELPEGSVSPLEYADALLQLAEGSDRLHLVEDFIYKAIRVDLAILCPLPLELARVLVHVEPTYPATAGRYTYFLGRMTAVSGEPVTIAASCLPEYGNLAAQEFTAQVILRHKPRYLCVVGICGGIRSDQQSVAKGDLIIPDRILYYEMAKDRIPYSFVDRVYSTSTMLVQRVKAIEAAGGIESFRRHIEVAPPEDPPPSVNRIVGVTIASGEKVLDNAASPLMQHLRANPLRVAGVEMESAGVASYLRYISSESDRPELIVIRCIADLADGTKDRTWQLYCADVAATYLSELIRAGIFSG